MDAELCKRFGRRMIPVLPFLVAIVAFRVWQDLQKGVPVPTLVLLNGIPLLLMGLLVTGVLWFMSKPVPGARDRQAGMEQRRVGLMRKVAVLSFIVHLVLAVGLLVTTMQG